MSTFIQHCVTFRSPGTMFDEYTTRPIASWDPAIAVGMAEEIVERYGAKPYAFEFSTALCAEPVADGFGGTLKVEPKTTRTSGLHYIKGVLLTYDDVIARGLTDKKQYEKDWALRGNMSSADRCIACVTKNSYMHHGNFGLTIASSMRPALSSSAATTPSGPPSARRAPTPTCAKRRTRRPNTQKLEQRLLENDGA